MSYVDFYFFEIVKWLDGEVFKNELTKQNPTLKSYMVHMENLEGFSDVWSDNVKCIKSPFNGNMAWIGGAQ